MAKAIVVSVAMASFNGEKYISKQLESIAGQTRVPDELVVCDDNSTDHTVQILQEFAEKVPFLVKVIRNSQNKGFVATFNKALEATKGDLVFLCDQDDYWFSEKIAHTCRLAVENPEAKLLMNNAELVDGELNPSGFTTFGQMAAAIQNPQDLVLGCCMAVKKELLEMCLPIPGNFQAHDVWMHEFSSYLDSKLLIPEVLQYYRRHQKNESAHLIYSLKKINWLDYKIYFYKQLFFKNGKDSIGKRISNNLLRIYSLEKAIPKALEGEKLKLENARNRFKNENFTLIKRQEFAQMGFFQRLSSSKNLLLSRSYNYGIKNFLRDLFGYSG